MVDVHLGKLMMLDIAVQSGSGYQRLNDANSAHDLLNNDSLIQSYVNESNKEKYVYPKTQEHFLFDL